MTHKVTLDYWPGLYREGWGRDIVPEAYAHPAKYARALIRKIYAHAVDLGWLEPGDVVLDLFGGVALGGLDASYHGAHWVGVELERHFVDTGAGCDCTGINKADWVRFYGRWERARTLEGRHWCPRCLAQAKQVTYPDPQLALFDREPSAAYVRSSGRIPETLPHHYTGNAEHWRRFGFAGSVTLLQGDSRRLLAVVQEAGLAVSSPPYANSEAQQSHGQSWREELTEAPGSWRSLGMGYGSEPGQLGTMPEGDHGASLAVSSPPYADGCRQQGTDLHPERLEGTAFAPARYDLAVSSPPYAESLTQGNDGDRYDYTRYGGGGQLALAQRYGADPGNLGNLPAKDGDHRAALAVSSPPFCDSDTRPTKLGGGHPTRATGQAADRNKGDYEYPDSPGQLGTMPEGDPGATLSVSSPPYEESVNAHDCGIDWSKMGPATGNRRRGPGSQHEATLQAQLNYNPSAGNLGAEERDTFWTAARAILEQVYQALRPGGHAIWVVKAFVRDGAVVDFPGQWRALCEAVGFVTLHEHRALLVEEHGAQLDLEGNHVKRQVARKSFFRRIYEQKYPANRIDFEVVYCMEKPG